MAKKKKNRKNAQLPKAGDQRTVETTLFEPRLIADKASVSRIFQAIDAAQGGNTSELFSMYRDFILADSHVQGEFSKRKLAVLGDKISIAPAHPDDPADVDAAAFISEVLKGIPDWIRSCSAILDSCLWPVSVTEKVFTVTDGRFIISKIVPVPHHLEDYTKGFLRLQATDSTGIPLSEYAEVDPDRYIVHRGHLLTMPDNYGGPMRSILFWTLFRACNRDWWVRFLERFGSPFLVGKYESGDDNTRNLLRQAFSAATKLFGIAVSRDVDIELQQANQSSGDAFKTFIDTANAEISRLIVGQTLSSTASATGLGSGVSQLQSDVRDDIRQFDALMLLETIKQQVVDQLLEINGFDGEVSLSWGSASLSELRQQVGLLKDLYQAGLVPAMDALETISSKIGFTVERAAVQQPVAPLSADTIFYRRKPSK
jgi:phage gp29-like protein